MLEANNQLHLKPFSHAYHFFAMLGDPLQMGCKVIGLHTVGSHLVSAPLEYLLERGIAHLMIPLW